MAYAPTMEHLACVLFNLFLEFVGGKIFVKYFLKSPNNLLQR